MPRYMGGARGSLLAGLTTNIIPRVSGLSLVDSSLTDDGSTLASNVPVLLADGSGTAPSLAFSSAPTWGAFYDASSGINWRIVSVVPFSFTSTGLFQTSDTLIRWSSDVAIAGAVPGTADTIIARAAAATPYFYGSSTAVGATLRLGNTNVGYEDFARNSEAHTLAAAGTSTTATAVWPAGSGSQAAAFRITTEITGCTSVQVGVAGDVTRYGTFNTLTVGQTIAIGRIDNYAAATGILFTAVGGGASFTAGVVRVNLRYITASASTS